MVAILRQFYLDDTRRGGCSGAHTLRWQYSKDASGSGGSDCIWVDHIEWIPPSQGGGNNLDEYVDSLLTYTTGGDADWQGDLTTYFYDQDSACNGDIEDSEESWMQTTVEDEGTFSFYWKVSSESGYDWLEFYIDSTLQTGRISGSTNWAQKSYDITGSGTHTLKWRYVKDGSESSGSDCGWVDYVQWSGTTQNPLPTEWTTITYTYDSAGRRIEKAYDGTTVMKYLYDGDHIIAEYDGNNNLLHKYIYGPGVDQPICMIDVNDSNAVYYYHFDGLGSVIALTNAAGSVVNLYEYSVYGEVSASDPNHPNRFLFTGREFDKDTGLYYYRARYYNPYIGRFLQTDPIGYGDGMNWYNYCGNGPVNSTDPSGCFGGYIYFEDRNEVWELYGDWNGLGFWVSQGYQIGLLDTLGTYDDQIVWSRATVGATAEELAECKAFFDAWYAAGGGSATAGEMALVGSLESLGPLGPAPSSGMALDPIDVTEPLPSTALESAAYWVEGIAEGVGDGITMAVLHGDTPEGRYGLGTRVASHGLGYASEAILTVTGAGAAKCEGRRENAAGGGAE